MKKRDEGLLLSKYVTPGSRIELEAIDRVLQADGSYKKKKFESKVVDVLDEDHIEILMPMEQTKLILLPVNGQYDLHFFSPKGLFQCFGKVVNRYKNDNLYLLELEMISDLAKYQRREYYRYTCDIEVQVKPLTKEETDAVDEDRPVPFNEDVEYMSGRVVDISGGGMRFLSDFEFPVDSYAWLNYKLVIGNNTREYTHIAKILGSRPLENRPNTYEHRVIFLNIQNGEREQIIRFIFEEERRKRQGR